jgi:hypothetical protein
MKKYIVSLEDNSLEIELSELTESNIFDKVEKKFSLIGTFIKKLAFVKSLDIYTLTLTKRGYSITLLVKEIKEVKTLGGLDISRFNNEIDKLLNGEIDTIYLEKIGKDEIDDALGKKNFKYFETDNDNTIITYFYGHIDWDFNDNGEYINRLNVALDVEDFSIEIILEDGYSRLEDLADARTKIATKNKEIEALDIKISNLQEEIEQAEDDKRDLESDIENIESDITNTTYY